MVRSLDSINFGQFLDWIGLDKLTDLFNILELLNRYNLWYDTIKHSLSVAEIINLNHRNEFSFIHLILRTVSK